jgi:hypothetical protein
MDYHLFGMQKEFSMITAKDIELRMWSDSFITQCDTNKAA